MRNWRSLSAWGLRPTSGKHYTCLDGIRGVAILLVVAAHAFYYNPAAGKAVQFVGGIIGGGIVGVPLFFVLSGFVISLPFMQAKVSGNPMPAGGLYFRNRVFKIIPPFYLAIVVFATLFYSQEHDPGYWHGALRWASGVANVFPPPSKYILNGSFWSLLVEAQFYLVIYLVLRLAWSFSLRTIVALVVVCFWLIPTLVRWITFPPGSDIHTVFFLGQRLPCGLDYFAFGVLFGAWHAAGGLAALGRNRCRIIGYTGAVLLVVYCILLGWMQITPYEFTHSFAIVSALRLLSQLGALGLLAFINLHDAWLVRFFESTWLRFIGLVSFEWFLIHQPMLFATRNAFGPAHGSIIQYMLMVGLPLLVSFLLAILVYYFYSLPILRFGRGAKSAPASTAS